MRPPVTGSAALRQFALDPDFTHLNHGSYGATPLALLDAQDRWRRALERNPTRFLSRELVDMARVQTGRPGEGPELLRHAAEAVAAEFGGAAGDYVFVPNTTAGINAVVAGFPLAPGDRVLLLGPHYSAVGATLRAACARTGAVLDVVPLPWPAIRDEGVTQAVAAALTPRTRLAILDHVTSSTATVMPVTDLARLCRERGAAVLVDGAHAPGMLPLDIPAVGADWYVGNMHKWICAPKGAAILWTAPDRQDATRPQVVSHGAGGGYTDRFDVQGTLDPSAYLTVPDAIAWCRDQGGPALREHGRRTALAMTGMLAAELGTEAGPPPAMTGMMRLVRLPDRFGPADAVAADRLRRRLSAEHRIEVVALPLAGALWLRLSAFLYNEVEDAGLLLRALERVPAGG